LETTGSNRSEWRKLMAEVLEPRMVTVRPTGAALGADI
jgi:hypothetical protein